MDEKFDRWQVVMSACFLSAVGATVYNILPIFVGSVQDVFQLSHARTGFVPSVFYLGFGFIAASAYFWIRQVNWCRLALLCIPASLVSLVLLPLSNAYASLLIIVFLMGCSFGTMYSLGSTIIGDTARPARNFGFKIGAENALGIILLFTLPGLVLSRWGLPGIVSVLVAVVLILGLTFVYVPERGLKGHQGEHRQTLNGAGSVVSVWYCLTALLLFFSGMSAVWAFVERMAASAGIGATAIGNILAVSLVFGLIGAFSAAIIGERKGNSLPLFAGLTLCLTGNCLLGFELTTIVFAMGISIFNMAFAFTIPYFLSLISIFDSVGRYIVLTVPAISLGIVIGPAIAGLLIGDGDYLGCIYFTAVNLVVSAFLVQRATVQ